MHIGLKRCVSKDQFFRIKQQKPRVISSKGGSMENKGLILRCKSRTGKHFANYLGINIKQSVTTTADSQQILKFRTKPLLPKKRFTNIQTKLEQYSSQSPHKLITKNMFNFIAKIGGGSYSQVYQAIHNPTGLLVVLKVFKKLIFTNNSINLHLTLDHPNICKLWGFFDDTLHIYLICQPCIQGDLYNLLNSTSHSSPQGLAEEQVRNYMRQLARAVHYLHENRIIHRDIKPQNVVLSIGGTVKLCDFGQSVRTGQKYGLRKTICGTPLYLAPELVERVQYDKSVDIWAMGILTYELLTGRIPFKIKSIGDLRKIVEDQIEYDGIKQQKAICFIKKMLQKNSHQRIKIQDLINHQFLHFST